MPRRQKTISREVSLSGPGLHNGGEITIRLKPGAVDTGLVFIRTDLPGKPKIPATIAHVTHRMRRTAIALDEQTEVQTPEHLLAACYGAGIDNLEIEIDGLEVPGADGSALPFYQLLQQAGYQKQEAEKTYFVLRREVKVAEGKATIEAREHEQGLFVDYTLDHDLSFLPAQRLTMEIDEETFAREIAPARTFVLRREVEALQKMGLGKGATAKNTLVLDDNGEIIDNSLRFPDEFVRHKVLDLLGDLLLLGQRLQAHIVAQRSGHALNAELVKKIIQAA